MSGIEQKEETPERRTFLRFTLKQRLMHWLFAVSFVFLTLTGFSLKFETFAFLVPVFGGIYRVRLIHYTSAIGLSFAFFCHLFADVLPLCIRAVKRFPSLNGTLWDKINKTWLSFPMLPNHKDLQDLKQLILYYRRATPEKPKFDRFNLNHKFGYLAIFWGMPMMMITGLVILAPLFFTNFFSGELIHFGRIAHGEEACLAAGVIFIWHMYDVRFPFVKRMITGRIGEEEIKKHHPLEYDRILRQEAMEGREKNRQGVID